MGMRLVCNNTHYRAFICYSCHAIQHCQGPPLLLLGEWGSASPSGGGLNLHRWPREVYDHIIFDNLMPVLLHFLPGLVLSLWQ